MGERNLARMTRNFHGGSVVHNVGAKADRDRAVILQSYQAMVKEFRIRKSRQLTPREIATMTNAQLFQASKDLYNSATVKQASRLAKKVMKKYATPSAFARVYATVRIAFESAVSRLRGFRIEKEPEEKPVDNSHLLFMTGDGNG